MRYGAVGGAMRLARPRSCVSARVLVVLLACLVTPGVVGEIHSSCASVGAEPSGPAPSCSPSVSKAGETPVPRDGTRDVYDTCDTEHKIHGAGERTKPSASPSQNQFREPTNLKTEFLADRYIVRFNAYAMIGEHRASLERILGAPNNVMDLDPALYGSYMDGITHPSADGGVASDASENETNSGSKTIVWEWVERANKASGYPTDFAVIVLRNGDFANEDVAVRFSGSYAQKVSEKLKALASVKDVRLEQKFTRALSWDETGGGRGGDESSEESRDEAGGSSHRRKSRRHNAGEHHKEGGDKGNLGLRWSEEKFSTRKARRREERNLGATEKSSETDAADDAAHGGGGGHRPGRLRTRDSVDETLDDVDDSSSAVSTNGRRHLLRSQPKSPPVAQAMGASFLWEKGFTGQGVKMGVFDTGVKADHPHFRKIKERSNWTHENTLDDGLGHGTFVAGVVASQDPECPGFAPDAEIHTFRVFTNDQVSYTSWFLDAFNYAIASEVRVINLSIGGPDYLDLPFTDKISEIVGNGIIMVSAIGNDGPLWGTLNNPADSLEVIGVGGIDWRDEIAPFSSRGMSTHELPSGYGRVKPDVVAYGRDVMGSKIGGGCRSLSGTSVASPVVAGAMVLLASTVPPHKRWDVLNPGSMKQALVEGAVRLTNGNGDKSMYAQGAGKVNLVNSFQILQNYTPRASLVPGELNFEFQKSCPYAWPHCTAPLYAGAMPFMFNATIVNGMGLGGWVSGLPRFIPTEDDPKDLGSFLDFRFDFSPTLSPWSGFLAIYVRVSDDASRKKGTASGVVTFQVQSPPGRGETDLRTSTVTVPVTFSIIPKPPRAKRILWSQYHSVRYPPGYVPRDSLDVKSDILDWHGDHPHTNFHKMYDYLVSSGYYLEILGSPLTCFDAGEYGAVLLVDSEEEYSPAEIAKLEHDVKRKGLGVAVFAEWYNVQQMESMKFFDDNTHSYWTPVTGGGNVPALNDLLRPFQISLGDRVLKGTVMLKSGEPIVYASGCDVAEAPSGAHVHKAHLVDHSKNSVDGVAVAKGRKPGSNSEHAVAVFLDEKVITALGDSFGSAPKDLSDSYGSSKDSSGSPKDSDAVASGEAPKDLNDSQQQVGRVSVFGDSNCLDSSHSSSECFPFLVRVLKFLTEKDDTTGLTPGDGSKRVAEKYQPYGESWVSPKRRTDIDFDKLSTTKGGRPGNEGRATCGGANGPLQFMDADFRLTSVYAVSDWSARQAKNVIGSRQPNWRQRLSDAARREIDALEDLFSEPRREVTRQAGALTGSGGVGHDGDGGDLGDTVDGVEEEGGAADFAVSKIPSRVPSGAVPSRVSSGFSKHRPDFKPANRGSGGASFDRVNAVGESNELGLLSSIVEKVNTRRSFHAAVAFFGGVAICLWNRARRNKRGSKKSGSKTGTPAKRGRRLAP